MKTIVRAFDHFGRSAIRELVISLFVGICLGGSIIAIYFLLYQSIMLVVGATLIALLIPSLHLARIYHKYLIDLEFRRSELSSFLDYVRILISGDVALSEVVVTVLPFFSVWMQDCLQTLLTQIKQDESSHPFVVFMSKFNSPESNVLTLLLYEILVNEERSLLLCSRFAILVNDKIRKREEHERKKYLNSINIATLFPIIGASVIIMVIAMGILVNVGGIINGL